jgi:hypothetical protein
MSGVLKIIVFLIFPIYQHKTKLDPKIKTDYNIYTSFKRKTVRHSDFKKSGEYE